MCQKATFALQQIFLFDHLVGTAGQGQRNSEAERLRGLHVDDEFDARTRNITLARKPHFLIRSFAVND
jgi:hypothetical protein